MIYTARQLEDLHRSHGQIVLPYGARLTPLASDWAKSKKITIGYSNVEPTKPVVKAIGSLLSAPTTHPLLWWCDGPCGAAKAAVSAQARETSLVPLEGMELVAAIKQVATEVKAGRASGGVLLVQSGAAAMLYANRCLSLRAVLGTCLESVEQGIQLIAANVLVIEYPYKTLSQIKTLLSRFARGNGHVMSESVKQKLAELSSCG